MLTKSKKKKRGRPRVVFQDEFYVASFRYALDGLSNTQIAKRLKVQPSIYNKWALNNPALKDALREGRKNMKSSTSVSFRDYVYGMLPLKMRKLWKKINRCENEQNGLQRIDALFNQAGLDARKHLFLYALTTGHFNPSVACRKVGISKGTMENWKKKDPDFAELVDEIHFHKRNFFESKLVEKVHEGDTQAVLFVNRTINRDRGYGEKMEVEVNGQIRHEHMVRIDELDLDKKTMRIINDALSARMATEVPTGTDGQTLQIPDKREKNGSKSK